ncbi:MAG: MFS transporter [Candidatus Rariloculaceae bacterium]
MNNTAPPKRIVYFGWFVVGASVVGLATGWSALFFTFGAFIQPLSDTFGWQRAEISVGFSIVSLTAVFVSPLLGVLVDRNGVRRVLLPSAAMLGVVISSSYWLSANIWHFYLIWLGVAVLGAGTSPLSYSRLIVKWFDRRRGLALGIGLAGVGIGSAILPQVVQAVTSAYGWREAYLALGAIVLLISLPILYIWVRDDPRDLNLAPDGNDILTVTEEGTTSTTVVAGFTAREAARQPAFWLMIGLFAMVGLTTAAIIAHLIPLMIDRGASLAQAATAQSMLGISLIFGRVVAGYLMDRFFAPRVALAFLLGPLAGLALLANGASGVPAITASILVGLATGAEFDVMSYLTSRYFGLRSFGQLYGYFFSVFQLGAAFGPLLMGFSFDANGTYTAALWILVGATFLACVFAATIGPYPNLPEER